jgi:DNA-directed RNA polymerase subunit L
MKVANIVESDYTTTFTLSGVDKSIANAIRRTIMSEIQCVGIRTTPIKPTDTCDVDITVNTCRFNNEIIKQRLSCIPIHIVDMDTPIDQLRVEVDVCNNTDDFMYVTTEHIKILNTTTDKYLSIENVREIFPPNPQTGHYIIITRLRPRLSADVSGEHITFTSKLSFVDVSENSMFNVVSTCSYGNTPDNAKIATQRKIKEQELKDSGITGDNITFEIKNWSLHDAQRLYLPDSFDFTIKTIGVFTCKEIIQRACDKMVEKLTNVQTIFDKGSPDISDTNSTIKNGFDIKLHNEDYTIGMIIQHLAFIKYYEEAKTMTYCAAKKLHPHDTFIMIKLGYTEETNRGRVIENMISITQTGTEMFKRLRQMF